MQVLEVRNRGEVQEVDWLQAAVPLEGLGGHKVVILHVDPNKLIDKILHGAIGLAQPCEPGVLEPEH